MNNNNNEEPEDNNNGDINGNSEMVDQNLVMNNLVHHRQQQQQQGANLVNVAATVHQRGATATAANAVSPVLQRRIGPSSVRASPVLWHPVLSSSATGSLSAVHDAALAPSRHLYRDDSSSSDSDWSDRFVKKSFLMWMCQKLHVTFFLNLLNPLNKFNSNVYFSTLNVSSSMQYVSS